MKLKILLLTFILTSFGVHANDDTLDAAIGAGVGGAVGAAIGNELGGRNGAYIGGALGATAGVNVATDRDGHHSGSYRGDPYYNAPRIDPRLNYQYPYRSGPGYHCPPGQAKKGRC